LFGIHARTITFFAIRHAATYGNRAIPGKEAENQSVILRNKYLGRRSWFTSSTRHSRLASILPNHVHLVIANPGMLVEQMVVQLKSAATRQLEAEGFIR